MTKCGIITVLGATTLLLAACGDSADSDGVGAGTLASDTAAGSTGDQDDADGSTGGAQDDADGDGSSGAADDAADGDAGSDDGGQATCEQANYSVMLEPGTPRVMLVLDKSRSMTAMWDHDGDPNTPNVSRWNSLYHVVDFLTSQFGEQVEFGAQLFPSAGAWLDEPTNDFSCLVQEAPEIAVGPGTAATIGDIIPGPDDLTISGGTPATAGILSAAEHLMMLGGSDPRAIILVTDGAANCNPTEAPEDTLFVYDAELPGVVESTFADMKIPVYVVGINILDQMGTKPAVNAYESLNEVALAGGAPAEGVDSFYNTFNEAQLSDALTTVAGQIECTVNLQDEPEHPDLVEITAGGVKYDEVVDCESENGWVYTSPGGPYNAIRLCGSACDTLQGDGGTVAIDYTCPQE
jgi:hypothetical protein